jgi:hypothetical protein
VSYLTRKQVAEFGGLLKTFFTLPYSTDLDGKDAETLLRMVKGSIGPRSKRKELFDIIDGHIGYSVKTLKKPPRATRVDLQEQRFCDVDEVRRLRTEGKENADKQGAILLGYMSDRIQHQMKVRSIKRATSLILLKHWDKDRKKFEFLYWEEDFIGYVQNLIARNKKGEIEWLVQDAGLHARDRMRKVKRKSKTTGETVDENVRLLRMHYKHNQIFTDHDIPKNAVRIQFSTTPLSWKELRSALNGQAQNDAKRKT